MTFWVIYVIAIIIGTEISAYIWHRYGAHNNYILGVYDTHSIHHIINLESIAPNLLLADNDFVWILFLIIIFQLMTGMCIIIGLIPRILGIITIIIILIVFIWNWWIHRTYHIPDHWLNSYQWFRIEKYRHFIHHYNPNKNYGISSHFTDKLLNTWIDIPN